MTNDAHACIERAKSLLRGALREVSDAVVQSDYDDLDKDYRGIVSCSLGEIARIVGDL